MSISNNLYSNLEKKYGKLTLSVEEVATELGVHADDVTSAIEAGDIAVKHLGTRVLIPISSLIDFLGDEKMAYPIDLTPTSTVTSSTQESINIVEDDIDMAKGTVTQIKSSGIWIYQIDMGKTQDGKRIRKTKSFKSESETRAALAVEVALINGISEDNNTKSTNPMTVKELIEAYLKLENRSATSRSLDNYYTAGRQISKEYGYYKLCDLQPENLIMFFNKLKKTCSDSIILKSYLFLKMIMEYAVSKSIISLNPMSSVKKPKSEKIKGEEYRAFTSEELTEIMSAAKAHAEIYPILLLLQNTGMRPGELRALKIENIDFQNKTVIIKNAATFKFHREGLDSKPCRTEYIGPTKSSYSVRTLILPDVVLDALKSWRDYINTNSKYKNAANSEYLFPNVDGDFIKDDHLRKKFRKFLKDVGLYEKGYHLYKYRHTMCTNLVLKNTPIPVIQRIMGDNTTDVILKIYTSVNSTDITTATAIVQQHFNNINNPIQVV